VLKTPGQTALVPYMPLAQPQTRQKSCSARQGDERREFRRIGVLSVLTASAGTRPRLVRAVGAPDEQPSPLRTVQRAHAHAKKKT